MNTTKPTTTKDLAHEHTCKTCNRVYTHVHDAASGDHPQNDFQCAYPDCSNAIGKGDSGRPPRLSWIGPIGQYNPPSTPPKAQRPNELAKGPTGKEKSLSIWRNQGHISCLNPDHFIFVKENLFKLTNYRDGDKQARRKSSADILSYMTPLKEASCECEREACTEAWSWNAPGVRQSAFVVPGKYHKGTGVITPGCVEKLVLPIGFNMSPSQLDVLHKRFPAWLFISTRTGTHDHPVSHVTTQVATFEMMDRIKRGHKILDLHGNPTANETWMRERKQKAHDIITYCNIVSPKDVLRSKTKWGPQTVTKNGKVVERWHTGPYIRDFDKQYPTKYKGVDSIVSVHTGYYYSPEEIVSVMRSVKEDATLTMIMHRFEGPDGTLNNKELSWKRGEGGEITQTNVVTGETYRHPDNSMWFNQSSYTSVPDTLACKMVENPVAGAEPENIPNPAYDEIRGLTWTRGIVCEDVYIITVVGCTAAQARMDETVGASSCTGPVQQVLQDGGVTIGHGANMTKVPIHPTHVELFDELRASIALKPRTEEKFKAHVATVASKCKGYLRDKSVKVDSLAQYNMAVASFWVDFDRDCALPLNLTISAQWMTRQHSLIQTGKSLSNGGNLVKLTLEVVGHALRAKGGKDTAAAVLHSVEAIALRAI